MHAVSELSATLEDVAPLALLLAARLLPLTWLVPRTALGPASWLASSALGASLGLTLLPLTLSMPHPALVLGPDLLPLLLAELLRGSLFALAVCLPLHAFAWTGALADRVRHALGQDDTDPALQGPLATLHGYGALALLFASGAHFLVLDALADGLARLPLGTLPDLRSAAAVAQASVDLVSRALALSVSLAAPVFLGLIVLTLALGLLARLSPLLASPFMKGPLVPIAGLGIVCLLIAKALPQAETALRVFLKQAEGLLRSFG